jgi:Na+-transporting NADH:ubiquinone oxidoreductase subunit NqrB
VTHLAAASFFVLALLAAAVALHMTVRAYWTEILMALRGELGRSASYRIVPVRQSAAVQMPVRVLRRAAF